jgi:hypothetical protein
MKARRIESTRTLFLHASLVLLFLATTACQQHTEQITNTKSAANETAAIGALRSIASAQSLYSVTHNGEYGTFEQLVSGGNLDSRFKGEQPVIGGYVLKMKASGQIYSVNADPQQAVAAGSTGSRHFYLDSTDNNIHVNPQQPASASDPTL